MGSRSNHRSNVDTAEAASTSERSGQSSSEQGIPAASSSITFLSDEALMTAPNGGESSTWERLLNEVAKGPGSKEISRHQDEDSETLAEGAAVGEYCVVQRLGRGTFGTVYQAVHPVIGKEVAVKVLNTRFAADAHVVRRFVEEARAVNRIRHPNIVDVFGFGELPDGRKFFVMELLAGETVSSMIERDGAIPPDKALEILKDVASALDATHARGILHRDLSPGNIFLVKDAVGGMSAKLLDFGVAKMLNDSTGLGTQTGALIGTPAYMSPEQCKGSALDHKSDIYSLGVIAHELLTGERPFSGSTVEHFVTKHIYSPPPRVSACNPLLPPALDRPVLRMLSKKIAERPDSASLAITELEQVWASLSKAERAGKRRHIPRALLFLGLGVALAVTTALALQRFRSTVDKDTIEAQAAPTAPRIATPPAVAALASAIPAKQVPSDVPPPAAPANVNSANASASAVIITLKGIPPSTLIYRGKQRLGRAQDGLVLPKSSERIELTLYARGYRPETVSLVPDRNHELEPTLTKTSSTPARSAPSRNVLGELEY